MANKAKHDPMCKSVFKSGESTTTTTQFTGAWVELINRLEKNKGGNLA